MLVLIMYTVSVPVLMWCWVTVPWLLATFTFIASLTFWLLHEVARDLEDPFLYEPNELPLPCVGWEIQVPGGFGRSVPVRPSFRPPSSSSSKVARTAPPHL